MGDATKSSDFAGAEKSTAQRNKAYKYGRGRGRGRGGDRGRGRGGDRSRGGRGGGGNGEQPWLGEDSEGVRLPLGHYRDDPLSDIMTCPGICATAIQNKERSAERELLAYLERVADELHPESNDAMVKKEPEDGDGVDLEEMLKRELAGMSVNKKSPRFRLCRHDTPSVIYINILPPLDANRLIRHILEQVERTAKCPFQFVRRIIPIAATSNATLNQLIQISESVIEEAFKTPDNRSLRFAINTNTRSSDRLERLDMIKTVADQVAKHNMGHKVDLENAERTILIELYKNTIGIGVVEDYDRYKKFNPWQVAEHAARNSGRSPDKSLERSASPSKNAKRRFSRERKAASMGPIEGRRSPVKRKAEVLEDGQVQIGAVDVEAGELVEDGDVDLGDDFEEVIQGGKAVKMRRV